MRSPVPSDPPRVLEADDAVVDAATELVDPGPSAPPSYLTLDDLHAHQVLASFRIQMPAGWIF